MQISASAVASRASSGEVPTIAAAPRSTLPVETSVPLAEPRATWPIDTLLQAGQIVRIGRGAINDVKVSNDKSTLALATSLGVQVFDTAGLKVIRILPTRFGTSVVAISPNGISIASNDDEPNITVTDRNSGATRTLPGKGVAMASLAFSSDGKRLVVGRADSRFQIYDVASGTILFDQNALAAATNADLAASMRVVLDATGERAFTTSFSDEVLMWDVATAKVQTVMRAHSDLVSELAISPDGRVLASTGDDRLIVLWDAVTGAKLRSFGGHPLPVHLLSFSKDSSLLASGDTENAVKVWRVDNGAGVASFADSRYLHGLGFTAGNDALIVVSSSNVSLYDIPGGNIKSSIGGFANAPNLPIVNLERNRVIYADDEDVLVIDNAFSGSARVTVLAGHLAPVNSLRLNSAGTHLLSGSLDGTLLDWDLNTANRSPTRLPTGNTNLTHAQFAPDDKGWRVLVLTALEQRDANGRLNGSVAACLKGAQFGQMSPKQMSYALAVAGTLSICDTGASRSLASSSWEGENIVSLVYSADGRWLAGIAEAGAVRVWNAETLAVQSTVASPGEPTLAVAFNVDGSRLAVGGLNRIVRIVDPRSGAELRQYSGHTHDVLGLAFSTDGTVLVSTSADGTLRIWRQ